jgi:hypothetical protein
MYTKRKDTQTTNTHEVTSVEFQAFPHLSLFVAEGAEGHGRSGQLFVGQHTRWTHRLQNGAKWVSEWGSEGVKEGVSEGVGGRYERQWGH